MGDQRADGQVAGQQRAGAPGARERIRTAHADDGSAPQVAALHEFVRWAKRRALAPATIAGLEAVVAAFAADAAAPDLELAIRAARTRQARRCLRAESLRPG